MTSIGKMIEQLDGLRDTKDISDWEMKIKTAKIVKILPTRIWIESDFFGARHVVLQHEGYEPFRYATFNYNYAYTSNSNIVARSEKLAKELGAVAPIEHRFITHNG